MNLDPLRLASALALLSGGALATPLQFAPTDSLTPPGLTEKQHSGCAIDRDGTLLAIGGYGSAGQPGRVDLYQEFGLQHLRTILEPDGPSGSLFGWSVVVHGGEVFVGAPHKDVPGVLRAGAVYRFDASSGALLQVMTSPAPHFSEDFGYALAVNDDHIVVGAPVRSLGITQGLTGAVHVFARSDGSFQRVIGPDPSMSDPDMAFGHAVALGRAGSDAPLFGDLVVVGSPYRKVGTERRGGFQLFTAGDGLFRGGIDGDAADGRLGWSLDTEGSRILVGEPGAGGDQGAVHLYRGATLQHQVLPVVGLEDSGLLGYEVVMSGNQLVAGAPGGAGAVVVVLDVYNLLQVARYSHAESPVGGGLAIGSYLYAGAPSSDSTAQDGGETLVFMTGIEVGSAFCTVEDAGTACPCSGAAGGGAGCPNSTGSGARLWTTGIPSLQIGAGAMLSDATPDSVALLIASTSSRADATPFGDGLLCLAGSLRRLAVKGTSLFGGTEFKDLEQYAVAGETAHYQVLYRDPAGCSGMNLSSGWKVLWTH